MAAPALAAAARAVLPALGKEMGKTAGRSVVTSMLNRSSSGSEEPSSANEGSSILRSAALNECFDNELGSCRT